MDSKRFFVIVVLSLIFILLFCKEDNNIVEGQTNEGTCVTEEVEECATLQETECTQSEKNYCEWDSTNGVCNTRVDVRCAAQQDETGCESLSLKDTGNSGSFLARVDNDVDENCVWETTATGSGTCVTEEIPGCVALDSQDTCTKDYCEWDSSNGVCNTRQVQGCSSQDNEVSCVSGDIGTTDRTADSVQQNCEWVPDGPLDEITFDTSLLDDEKSKCESNTINDSFFSNMKLCLSESSGNTFVCNGTGLPDANCMRSCFGHVLVDNGATSMTAAENLTPLEEKQIIQDVVDECEPDQPGILGTDCVLNCKEFAHSCEIKNDTVVENGVETEVKTYGNVEECPNGEVPERTCHESLIDENGEVGGDEGEKKFFGWACKECEDGYYLDSNNLCKPTPSLFSSILSCLIFIACIGLVIFLYIKFGAYILKTGAKAVGKGWSEGTKTGTTK